MAKNLARLCSSVLWKVGLASDKTGYLLEISYILLKLQLSFLFTAYSKMREERDRLKKLFSKKKTGLKDLNNSRPMHVAKN